MREQSRTLDMAYDNTRIRRQVGQYLRYLREEVGLTNGYVIQVRSTLLSFLRYCRMQGVSSASGVTPPLVRGYLDSYSGASVSHIRFKQTAIRRFLEKYGNHTMDNMRMRISGTLRTKVDWLTPEECRRVFETPMTSEQMVLIGGGLLQGLRRCEMLRITAGEARTAVKSGILRVHGKAGKQRIMPLHEDFKPMLEYHLRNIAATDHEPLLEMKRTRSETVLKEFCRSFGRPFSFHTLRRSFGRNLWLLGIQLETISELLGHSDTRTTREYLGLNLTDMKNALKGYNVAR